MSSRWSGWEDQAIAWLQELIRIDTTNPPGNEIRGVEWLQGILDEASIDYQVFEPEPGRGSLVARVQGSGSEGPLVLSGHLDVVPADPDVWTHPPFGGVIADGYLWGRGAIDMKHMIVLSLVCLLQAKKDREAGKPWARDLVLAALADEEAGCDLGSTWLAANHPEALRGAYTLSEVGGFSVTLAGQTFYMVQVAEKGLAHLRIRARGREGHGSLPNDDNAVARLGRAAHLLGTELLPMHATEVARTYIHALASHLPTAQAMVFRRLLSPMLSELVVRHVLPESTRAAITGALHNTAQPTILQGGIKFNQIPGQACLDVDGRVLPGFTTADLVDEVRTLIGPGLDIEVVREAPPLVSPVEDPIFGHIKAVIDELDPGAAVIPYLMPGFTDAKAYHGLGNRCYGFVPVKVSPEDSFTEWFHGVDERIPVEGFRFGVNALGRLVDRMAGSTEDEQS